MAGVPFTVTLQHVHTCGLVLLCIYHIPQGKSKHAGRAQNDTHALKREGNEIREVCADTFAVVILSFMSQEVST